MIRDLARDADALAPYDLCIVGSGPAGATVAAELADAGLRICVLESGVQRPTRHADALKRASSAGIHIKDWSRERVLGGASTTWAGLSSPFDVGDLEPRPGVRRGWPLSAADLAPFYAAAAERYRFPHPDHYGPDGFAKLRAKSPLQPEWLGIEERVFLACSTPQNFGSEQRAIYEEGVDLWLDATVTRLEHDAGGVTAAVARSRNGDELRIEARRFVVACGGIENARLLLVSGLGSEQLTGRGFMNHPKAYHGILKLARPVEEVPYFFGCLHQGFAGYAGLRLTLEAQNELGLIDAYVRLEPLFPWSDSQGVEALVLLVKKSGALFEGWKKRREDQVVTLRDYSETGDDSELQNARKSASGWLKLLGTLVVDAPRVLRYAFHRLTKVKPKIRRVRLRNFMEMEPVDGNRVVLSDERDPYGQPIAHVEHDTSALDRRSLVALHEALEREFERTGLGTLETSLGAEDPWPIHQDASHHMGSTAMGDSPTDSVVDPDQRLWDVPNTYLAGASVFPTSGSANPTYTLVALSIRLAAHLRTQLEGERP